MSYPRKVLERLCFVFVFTLCFLGVYYSRTDLSFYEGRYVREDGFIEWLTFFALFMGFVLNIYRAQILKPFRGVRFTFSLYAMALIFFFGLGEEISWGHRIYESLFDFRVPDFFIKYNTQGEMNLHNLSFGGTRINKLIFGLVLGIFVVIYFLILPFVYRKFAGVKKVLDSFALPLPHYYHIAAYLLLAGLCEFIEGGKKGEILEFGGCWIFLLMSFEPFNREIFSRKSLKR
jgi:hypothetical protein